MTNLYITNCFQCSIRRQHNLSTFSFTNTGGVAGSSGIHFLFFSVLSLCSSCLISSSSFFLFLLGERWGNDKNAETVGDLGDFIRFGDSGTCVADVKAKWATNFTIVFCFCQIMSLSLPKQVFNTSPSIDGVCQSTAGICRNMQHATYNIIHTGLLLSE